jgi:hypothetical protein
MASKSAITFAISNGLERNKVFLRFLLSASTEYLVPGTEFFVLRDPRAPNPRDVFFRTYLRWYRVPADFLGTGYPVLTNPLLR